MIILLGAQPSRGPVRFIAVTDAAKTEVVHESGDPAFDNAAAEFTRAVLAMQANNPDLAQARFDRVASSWEPLRDWSNYFAAESAAMRGDTTGVEHYLALTRADLRQDFGWRARTLGLEHARNFASGARLADSVAAASKASRTRALAYLRAGRMRLQLHDSAAARKAFFAAAEVSAGTDAAGDAADLLARYKMLTINELRALARVARQRGKTTDALRYYREALKKQKPGDERAQLLLEMGNFLFATRQYNTLRSELKKLVAGNGAYAGGAQLLMGRTELRDRNTKAALAMLRRCLASEARAQTRATAAFLLADVAHDAGDLKEADKYYRQAARIAPTSETAANAYLRRGGIAFAGGDFKRSAEIFTAYRNGPSAASNRAQAKYWLARSLAKTGKAEEATKLLTDIEQSEPYSYYAVLARRITGDSVATPAPGPASTPETTQATLTFARVVRLLRDLELSDAAAYEAAHARHVSRDMIGGSHAYAEAVQQLGGNGAGIDVGRQILAEGQWDARLLRIVYPFPYRELISREARKNGLAPDFVAAFIRQESLFEPRARSRVGALGLMQLMPQTARALNRWVSTADLVEPDVNVRIGTAHLRGLLAEYGGHTERLIAAYNAGGTPVARWARFPESRDPELFVERIPYDETREYVKIVQRNAWIYSWLYMQPESR